MSRVQISYANIFVCDFCLLPHVCREETKISMTERERPKLSTLLLDKESMLPYHSSTFNIFLSFSMRFTT